MPIRNFKTTRKQKIWKIKVETSKLKFEHLEWALVVIYHELAYKHTLHRYGMFIFLYGLLKLICYRSAKIGTDRKNVFSKFLIYKYFFDVFIFSDPFPLVLIEKLEFFFVPTFFQKIDFECPRILVSSLLF